MGFTLENHQKKPKKIAPLDNAPLDLYRLNYGTFKNRVESTQSVTSGLMDVFELFLKYLQDFMCFWYNKTLVRSYLVFFLKSCIIFPLNSAR